MARVRVHLERAAPFLEQYVRDHPERNRSTPVGAQHLLTAHTLQAVHAAYREGGVEVGPHAAIPEDLDRVMTRSVGMARDLVKRQAPDFSKRLSTQVHDSFEAIDTLELLRDGFDGTPFEALRPEHRWRMCIDPALIDGLAAHGIDTQSNPLLGFAYEDVDNPAYLMGMAEAWQVSFEHLDGDAPDIDLVAKLNAACRGIQGSHRLGDKRPDAYAVHYATAASHGLTRRGLDSLVEFGRKVRSKLGVPLYAVGINPDRYQTLHTRFTIGDQDRKDQIAAELADVDAEALFNKGEPVHVIRPVLPRSKVESTVEDWLETCNESAAQAKEANALRRAVVDFCQQSERFHPSRDANTRVYGTLMLNHLLLRHGHPLVMLHQPNALDGAHPEELVKAVEQGRARVDDWRADSSNQPVNHASTRAKLPAGKSRTSLRMESCATPARLRELPASLQKLLVVVRPENFAASLQAIAKACPQLTTLKLELDDKSEATFTASGHSQLRDDDLMPLRSLPGLSTLELDGLPFDRLTLDALAEHPGLESVLLYGAPLSREASTTLGTLPRLNKIAATNLTAEAAAGLGECAGLTSLYLRAPGSAGLTALAPLPNARLSMGKLPPEWRASGSTEALPAEFQAAWQAIDVGAWEFPYSDIDGTTLRQLVEASCDRPSDTTMNVSLRVSGPASQTHATMTPGSGEPEQARQPSLSLHWTDPGDADLAWLATRTRLSSLRIENGGEHASRTFPRGLAALANATEMKELYLDKVGVASGSAGRAMIDAMMTVPLESLTWWNPTLGAEHVAQILELGHPTIQSLSLHGKNGSMTTALDGATSSGHFPALTNLTLQDSGGASVLRSMTATKAPSLESVWLWKCPDVEAADLQAVVALPTLRKAVIDLPGMEHVACRILGASEHLKEVSMYGDLPPGALQAICRCPSLEEFNSNKVHIDADAARAIGQHPALRRLTPSRLKLAHPGEATAVIEGLARSTTMERLDLRFDEDTPISAQACAALAHMGFLRELRIQGTLDAKALKQLAGFRELKRLDISDCQFAPGSRAALSALRRHPGIKRLELPRD